MTIRLPVKRMYGFALRRPGNAITRQRYGLDWHSMELPGASFQLNNHRKTMWISHSANPPLR